MIIQHNLPAINAHRQMGINNSSIAKSLEKLSSGYRINRAGDDAAGLAISEKMRGQISGLNQAQRNAQDGISLIQTAEGALNETHAILQRMRELSVQSANGTYQDDVDRENIQKEVDALKSEIDRISTSTHYNGIQLLDGSLGGVTTGSNEYGAKFGAISAEDNCLKGAVITSSISGVTVTTTAGAATKDGATAVWDKGGKNLTLNLEKGQTYSQSEIDNLIANASVDKAASAAPADITVKLVNGQVAVATDGGNVGATTQTAAGVRATVAAQAFEAGTFAPDGADQISITANSYGIKNNIKLTITADVGAGKENATITTPLDDAGKGEVTLHLSTGVDYSDKDIEAILKKAGLDYDVTLSDATNYDGSDTVKFIKAADVLKAAEVTGGAGVGKDAAAEGGKGLTFQIGANGSADQRVSLNVGDMSSNGIGVNAISVSTRDQANASIDKIDDAINTVSGTRADLGALQNRLEHTINNLGVASENLTASESRIRDVDMAKEMMAFTKNQILAQASQAMLAQANSLPQGVLQLLQ